MKIVQISPYAMSRPGGVQTHIRDLSAWLQSQGHDLRIICPPGDGAMAGNWEELGTHRNMHLHGTGFEISRASRTDLRHKINSLREWGADAVHLHTPWTPMLAWQLWRGLNLPTIATYHATLPAGRGFDPMRWYIRRAGCYFARRMAAVIVPSQVPYDQWRAMGQIPDMVLPPAIDLSAWAAAGDQTADTARPLRAIYLGRLEQRKGVALLPAIWQQVRQALPDGELIIAGDGPLLPRLKADIETHRIKGITLRPAPDDSTARALVARADLFLAPALHGESFGLVLAEAMAAGTPPVAAANAGFATVMTGTGAELLVPPGDGAAMAVRIITLAQDREKLVHLRDWGRNHAAAFDIASQGPTIIDLLRKSIDQ